MQLGLIFLISVLTVVRAVFVDEAFKVDWHREQVGRLTEGNVHYLPDNGLIVLSEKEYTSQHKLG